MKGTLVGGTSPIRKVMAALLTATAALLLVAGPAMAEGASFQEAEFYKTAGGPIDVVNADFDNDGILDLATANFFNSGTDDVSLLLGKGDGTFEDAENYDAVAGVTSLASGYFNGDENLDLVVTDQGPPGRFAVLFGNGTEEDTFDEPVVYDSGGDYAIDVAVTDFDEDEDLDLAIVNAGTNNVASFINEDGEGTFVLAETTITTGLSPQSVAIAYFNDDEDPDLAVANSESDSVSVFFGGPGFTFTPGPVVLVGDGPVSVIAADFDRDGDQDFATANNGSDDVSVVLNNGSGTFGPATQYKSGDEGPYSLTVADFNFDAKPDLAVANQFTRTGGGEGNNKGTVGVLTGNGNGTFDEPQTFDTGDGPSGITNGDFNGDKKPDLATANFGGGAPEDELDTVSVLINDAPAPPDNPDPNRCEIKGTRGDDVIVGTPFDDVICGMEGHDTIYGGGGNDVVHGGRGQEIIYGEEGDDVLWGGRNQDRLDGGDGNDFLRGKRGKDGLNGEDGDDKLRGGRKGDMLEGGDGDDKLRGRRGKDGLNGVDGNDGDILRGGRGKDTCEADPGDKTRSCSAEVAEEE